MKAKFDKALEKWFKENPCAETTVMICEDCGLMFKPSLGHECKYNKVFTHEHKGYILQQTNYNWHYMIIDKVTDQMVMHCACTKKLSKAKAKHTIDLYIKLHEKADLIFKDSEEN